MLLRALPSERLRTVAGEDGVRRSLRLLADGDDHAGFAAEVARVGLMSSRTRARAFEPGFLDLTARDRCCGPSRATPAK